VDELNDDDDNELCMYVVRQWIQPVRQVNRSHFCSAFAKFFYNRRVLTFYFKFF